jgi:hypothetical protein
MPTATIESCSSHHHGDLMTTIPSSDRRAVERAVADELTNEIFPTVTGGPALLLRRRRPPRVGGLIISAAASGHRSPTTEVLGQ